MGVHPNVGPARFPAQGEWLGNRAEVAFAYDAARPLLGTVVRDDREDPFVTLIRLDDGRVVRAEECQYNPFAATSVPDPLAARDEVAASLAALRARYPDDVQTAESRRFRRAVDALLAVPLPSPDLPPTEVGQAS